MIVIPMLIQNLSFGFILKHFLNNDPGKAISFGGIFLLIAAGLTFFIKTDTPLEKENEMAPQ
jgi:maltose/moltooligosaccharide transporter